MICLFITWPNRLSAYLAVGRPRVHADVSPPLLSATVVTFSRSLSALLTPKFSLIPLSHLLGISRITGTRLSTSLIWVSRTLSAIPFSPLLRVGGSICTEAVEDIVPMGLVMLLIVGSLFFGVGCVPSTG